MQLWKVTERRLNDDALCKPDEFADDLLGSTGNRTRAQYGDANGLRLEICRKNDERKADTEGG